MDHFQRLKRMYETAPLHDFYKGIEIFIQDKQSEIQLSTDSRYHHAGNAVHGSVYFKLLDDCCYFACQSVVRDQFLVTTNFNINLLRPIFDEKLIAKGKLDFASANLFTASGELYNEKGKLCATGQGQFVRSKVSLEDISTYDRN